MGISNDAILVYGIDFGEGEDEDWNEIITEEMRDKVFDWDIHFITYCHYDYPMYFLGYEIKRGYRGQPVEITRDMLIPQWHNKDKEIKSVCEMLGLPYSYPQFYMTTING